MDRALAIDASARGNWALWLTLQGSVMIFWASSGLPGLVPANLGQRGGSPRPPPDFAVRTDALFAFLLCL